MKHYLNEKRNDKSGISHTGDSNAGYLSDIVREIGLSLSKSQEIIDQNLIESQRERLRILLDNPDLSLPPSSSFVVPEAQLELAMEVNGKYDNTGQFQIQTKPHNAKTTSKTSIKQSVSSRVALKFVMVPEDNIQEQNKPIENQSKLNAGDILKMAREEIELFNQNDDQPSIDQTHLNARYINESRKWHVFAQDGEETICTLIFDDTTSLLIEPILFLSGNLRTIENIDELSDPVILSVNKLSAYSGDLIELTGKNLGALNIADTQVTVGGKEVKLLEVSFEKISFKITPEISSGFIEITTPEGKHQFENELIIGASPVRFLNDSGYGYFNTENNQGSVIRINGKNISQNTQLKFANGALANVINSNPLMAEFNVPAEAVSGQVFFSTEGLEVEMQSLFYLRPFIKNVHPKEARHGEMIKLTGNHFSNIQRIKIGNQIFEFGNGEEKNEVQVIKSDTALLIKIPENAGDGRLLVESQKKWWDSSVFFYQVPKIETMPDYVIVGIESKIFGSGFGKNKQGLYLEFSKNEDSSILESSYISSEADFSNQHLAFIALEGMISDKIRIIRSDIADDNYYEETTSLWKRKTFIFNKGTQREDIIWCSPLWNSISNFWELTNIDLTAKKVLQTRQELNNLSLLQELPKMFSYFGEFYDVEFLNIQLDLLDESKHSAGNLKVEISPLVINLQFTPPSGTPKTASLEINEINTERFDRLFVQFYFRKEEFLIQVNEMEHMIILDADESDLKSIISDYLEVTTASKLSIQLNKDAFISAIVLSTIPTLSLPQYAKTDWDFEAGELKQEESHYVLYNLESFPTTETKELTLYGSGFTAYSTAVINEIRCLTNFDLAQPNQLKVTIPAEAENGELYIVDYLNPATKSNPVEFKILQGAKISSVLPAQVSSGDTIVIRGEYLTDNGIPQVFINKFGPLTIKELTGELLEVIAPKLTLINGSIILKYGDLDPSVSTDLVSVSALNNYNFLSEAHKAEWTVPKDIESPTKLQFGALNNQAEIGSVVIRDKIILDNIQEYPEALVLTCPKSEYRYLEGRFEDFYIPNNSELIFHFGFPEEARQTDGVKFSVFLELDKETISIIDPIYRGYGEELSTLNIPFDNQLPKGTLVIRVEPGASGYDDHLALVKAEMRFTHVEDGWTWLFGDELTKVLTIPGIQNETDDNSMPGARSFPAVWHDAQGQIWVFGGKGNDVNPRTGRLNDLWKYDGDNWTWKNGLISKNGFSKFGKHEGEITSPGARYAAAYWKDENGTFWLFGGHGYHESGRQRSLNDLWKLEDGDWTMVGISKGWKLNAAQGIYGEEGIITDHYKNEFTKNYWPLTRSHSAFWFDENTQLIWVFGGVYTEPKYHALISDLWVFDGENWTLMNGDPTVNYETDIKNDRPSARKGASIWTNEKGELFLFGGLGMHQGVERTLNDLWHFRKNKNQEWEWKRLSAPNLELHDSFFIEVGIPGPREHASIWKDNDGIIWLFGGNGSNTDADTEAPLNDLWKFENENWYYVMGPIDERDPGNLSAPKIPYPDSWPSARYGCGTWINPAGWLMCFGGYGYGQSKTGRKSLGQLQQMWQFSPEINKE